MKKYYMVLSNDNKLEISRSTRSMENTYIYCGDISAKTVKLTKEQRDIVKSHGFNDVAHGRVDEHGNISIKGFRH